MSTTFSADISLSKYSESFSVAFSKSRWLSWKWERNKQNIKYTTPFRQIIGSIFWRANLVVIRKNIPRTIRSDYFWPDNKQRRRCTWEFFGTHTKCLRLSLKTEPRSRTCCAVASLPSDPEIKSGGKRKEVLGTELGRCKISNESQFFVKIKPPSNYEKN